MIEMRPNILLITIDCGRQDMIYGDEVETPNIDKIRKAGVTFLDAHSQSNTTIPSFYSMFTSQYLSSHGVINQNPLKYKSLGEGSLPITLAKNGWKTRSFLGFDLLDQIMGRDIENCITGKEEKPYPKKKNWRKRFKNALKRKAKTFLPLIPLPPQVLLARRRNLKSKIIAGILVDKVLTWLSDLQNEEFFAWIHFFDAHQLYCAPQHWLNKYYRRTKPSCSKSVYQQVKEMGAWFPEVPLGPIFKSEKDIKLYPSLYKAALSYIDYEIGRLLEWLEENRKIDKTIIIVTSDHGENLLENGVYCGHYKLFDETIKVPLIFKDPLCPHGKEVSSMVQHIDIMPTLLERFSLSIPSHVQGKSLWPAIWAGEKVNPFVFSEHVHFYQKTVKTEDWQYLWADPNKKHPLGLEFEGNLLLNRLKGDKKNYASLYPTICKEMEGIIHKLSSAFQPTEEKDKELPQELIEKLSALGYLEF